MRIIFRIKEIRMQKRLTLDDVAQKANVSSTHINDIENQLKMPSLQVSILIANALGLDIRELYVIKW